MGIDVKELERFYASPLGALAQRLVGRALGTVWDDARGLGVLGLGYAVPFLPVVAGGCRRAVAFMPARQGAVAWPPGRVGATVLADPLMLPLADESVDRVLVVHALEVAESPAELLYEVARILAPSGRVVVICPNRRGLWARMDTTPFGQGQPFSRRQLRVLLRHASLQPDRWAETLYVPPLSSGLVLRGAGMWERVGATLSLPFAGLHIVAAGKQLHRPVPVRETRSRRRPNPIFVPVPASRTPC